MNETSAKLCRVVCALLLLGAGGSCARQKKSPHAATRSHVAPDKKEIGIPVLEYHGIVDTDEELDRVISLNNPKDTNRNALWILTSSFQKQMQWLKSKGYQTISPDDLLAWMDGGNLRVKHPVLITFDDGYKNEQTEGADYLKTLGYVGTFFVSTAVIDHDNSPGRHMTWGDLAAMQDDGMSIHSHTVSHCPLLTKCGNTDKKLDVELQNSEDRIQKKLGGGHRHFCYPGGENNANVREHVKKANYDLAFVGGDTCARQDSDRTGVPRLTINSIKMTPEQEFLRFKKLMLRCVPPK